MKGVIQVGANLAQEYEGWVAEGVENFIFFEPIAETYKKMCEILPKKDNIKTFRLAIGNMTGAVMINLEKVHGGKSCSVLNPLVHLEQYPDIVFSGKEMCFIDKLDNIEYDRSLYDHLHIDVQGYEMEVLKGAVESLKSIKTVEVEVYRAELYEGCPMFMDVVEWLYEQGFYLMGVKWIGRTWGNADFKRLPKI
jgi:FkbM family methyltransferase